MPEAATPAQRVDQAYRIWSESKGANSDHWMDLIDERFEMRSVLSEELPDDLAAYRQSPAAVREYFETMARDWEMLDFTVDRIVDGGEDVVMIGRCAFRNRATDRVIDTPKVDVWRFEGDHAVSLLEMFDSLGFMRATPVGAG
jgi:ketosteroid isomerase-like protein